MRVEIPVYKRCCFCLPLRYGLIVWGYLRLIFAILLVIGYVFTWHAVCNMSEKNLEHFTIGDRISLAISTAVAISDVPLSLLFIIGCHKKNVKLMKIFYMYSQFILGLTITMAIYSIFSIAVSLINHTLWVFEVMTFIETIAYIFMQLYMLLLLRSEIMKLNNGCEFRFVNLGAEAQCNLYDNNTTNVNETVIGKDNEVAV